jgi:hypothetical protein
LVLSCPQIDCDLSPSFLDLLRILSSLYNLSSQPPRTLSNPDKQTLFLLPPPGCPLPQSSQCHIKFLGKLLAFGLPLPPFLGISKPPPPTFLTLRITLVLVPKTHKVPRANELSLALKLRAFL